MTTMYNRRQLLVGLGAVTGAAMALRPSLAAAAAKPMRGIFPILATPYTAAGGVDFEDLVHQVEFFDKCGAHGMADAMIGRNMEVIVNPKKGSWSRSIFRSVFLVLDYELRTAHPLGDRGNDVSFCK